MEINKKIFLDQVYDILTTENELVSAFLFSKKLNILDLQLALRDTNSENDMIKDVEKIKNHKTYIYYLSKDIVKVSNKVISYILNRYNRNLIIDGLNYDDFELVMSICKEQDKKLFNFSVNLKEETITVNFLNGIFFKIYVHNINQFEIKAESSYNDSSIEEVIFISYLKVIEELSKAWKKQNLGLNH